MKSFLDQISSSDRNGFPTYTHLLRNRTLNDLAKLAKCLSIWLQTKWLWAQIQLLSLKL